VKKGKIYNIKSSAILGLFCLTNFFIINLFKFVDLKDIYIKGSELISKKEIIENTSLNLPTRLIFIKTKLIENELKKIYSLEQISVTREIFPLGLKIKLRTRIPVAFAEKVENGIKVEGFVDKEGIFIEKRFYRNKHNYNFPVKIFGWNKKHKRIISEIIKIYNNSNDLEVINISPEGFIMLEDKKLQNILLGYKSPDTSEKLNLIFDIKNQLRNQKMQKKIKNLDLTDPVNPRIKVFIP